MADQTGTTTRIVEIRANYDDAIRGVAEYTAKLEESKIAEAKLRDEIKKRGEATEEDQKQLAAIKAAQTEYKRGVQEMSKEVQNNIKTEKEKEGSLRSLRAELSNATKAYDALSREERTSGKGDDLLKHINDITTELKDAETASQRFYRNVGNYPEVTKPLKQQLREAREALAAMKLEGKDTGTEWEALSLKASQMSDAIGDVQQEIAAGASDTAQLDVLTKGLQNVLMLYSQYSVIAKNMGVENEDLDKTFQAIMMTFGLLSAATAVQNMLQKQSIVVKTANKVITWANTKATAANATAIAAEGVATKGATVAQWAFNKAAAANPIGIIVVAIVACIAAVYGIIKAFNAFTRSSEEQKKHVEESGKAIDALADKYDAAIERMKASGKSAEEIELNRLTLLRDLANKRAAIFAEAARLYKKDSEEYKAAADAKTEADATYQSGLRDVANMLFAVKAAAEDTRLKGSMDETRYAIEKANKKFNEQYDLLVKIRAEGIVTYNQMGELQKALIAERDQAEADALKAASEKAAERRKAMRATEEEAINAAIDAEIALMKDGTEKQLATENETYARKVETLRKRLATETALTAAAKAAINRQIELAEKQHAQAIAALDADAISKRIATEETNIGLRLAAVKKGSDEEYSLRVEQLNKQAEAELNIATLTAEKRLLIEEKYRAKGEEMRVQHANEQAQKVQDALRLEWENKINAAALNGQNTLQLELQQKAAELDAMHQLEGESDAQFLARQLQGRQEYAAAKKAIVDYEVEIEQAKYQSMSMIAGGIAGLFEELGEESKAAAIASKVITLAQIAIDTGRAIAAGTASASAVPFPGNLVAIATTVATVLANVTQAVKTVKSAKFATGGYVSGPGTGTSDSIQAQLSNGESVNNAVSTSMFAPLYSALNQLGGGIPIVVSQSSSQIAGEDMLARAVAKGVSALNVRVGVDEISLVQSRVSVVETLGDL